MRLNYDLKETARYLGYKNGILPTGIILELIQRAYNELCEVVSPEYLYKEYQFTKTDDGIEIDGFDFKSRALLHHLKDSGSVILLGATIGKGADELIKKYSENDITLATIIQAVGSSMVESLCDIVCEEIKNQGNREPGFRFSPGYGGLDLSSQKNFFRLLPLTEQLGISLNESCIMTPTKTVTAFIGIRK